MAGWRVGVAIKPEQEFGVVDNNADWHYVGVGMDMGFTENNGWRFQNGMGSKTPQLEFEGRFSGTWNGNLILDYNNFYWLQFGLEEYAFKTFTYPTQSNASGREIGIHIFTTSNAKSLKSFSMRFIKLDAVVGGYDKIVKADEELVLKGCVMNKVSPSYEPSSSAIKCSVGGVFADAETISKVIDTSSLGDDVVGKNNIRAINWGCLKVMNEENSAWEKIANNEKTSFSFNRTVSTVPECGQRIDTAYYEQAIQPIPITSLVYSRNPNQWQTRMHTGGVRNDIDPTTNTTSTPRRKGLEPIPDIRIESGTDNAQRTADYLCIADFKNVAVENWGNTYNAQGEITENPSLKARSGQIMFATPDVKISVVDGTAGEDYDSVVKVTYNFNNGNTPNLVAYYPEKTVIKLLDYKGSKTGYKFTGWTTAGGSSVLEVGSEWSISQDTEYTANWVAETP